MYQRQDGYHSQVSLAEGSDEDSNGSNDQEQTQHQDNYDLSVYGALAEYQVSKGLMRATKDTVTVRNGIIATYADTRAHRAHIPLASLADAVTPAKVGYAHPQLR